MPFWSVVAMIFISSTVMFCIVAIIVFNCWHRNTVYEITPQASVLPEFGGMSPRLVKAMKSLLFSSCEHKFHASFEPPATENTPLLSPTSSYEVVVESSTEIMSSFVYFSTPQESSWNVRRSFRSSNVRVSRSYEDIRQLTSPLQLVSQRSYSSWTLPSRSPAIKSLRRIESAETFSPFASSQSLPQCSTEASSQ